MPQQPNVLLLITDQMQGQAIETDSPCIHPHLDRLMERGLHFTRSYTPNAVCSPARASLMTGLLPHNHGVMTVTHCVDEDQSVLRSDRPQWAQRLKQAGYHNAYFGKWHVERTESPGDFGWDVDRSRESRPWREAEAQAKREQPPVTIDLTQRNEHPPGYRSQLFYEVSDLPTEHRQMGVTCRLARRYLKEQSRQDQPWCCVVSLGEPHDPYTCSRESYQQYDVMRMPLPETRDDDCSDKPALYRRVQQLYRGYSERQHREARTCYYASITDLDAEFGKVIDTLERTGQLDHTIILFTSDHGDSLGAHGIYSKNFGAFEEIYHIPMIAAGPGIAEDDRRGSSTSARVGLHELAPTLCDLAGAEPLGSIDGRSFAEVLGAPRTHEAEWTTGYAEYHGTRQFLTQRMVYEGPWKLIHNAFDFDELYHLESDPHELHNLAGENPEPDWADQHRHLMNQLWDHAAETGDRTLLGAQGAPLRIGIVGPETPEVASSREESTPARPAGEAARSGG